jgi:hypothetical protein
MSSRAKNEPKNMSLVTKIKKFTTQTSMPWGNVMGIISYWKGTTATLAQSHLHCSLSPRDQGRYPSPSKYTPKFMLDIPVLL